MRSITGRDFIVNYTFSRTYDVPEIYLDIARAKIELNWEPHTSMEIGIKHTWDFINNM